MDDLAALRGRRKLSFPTFGFFLALLLRLALLKLMPPPDVAGRSQEPAAPPVQSVGA